MSTLALLSLAACGTPDRQQAVEDAVPPAAPASMLDSTVMQAPGMPHSAMGSGALMAQMRQHMMSMQAAHADTGQAALARHRMGAQMLAQMEKDIEAAKLPVDPGWSALLDSVRQDMATMPGMRGGMMRGQGRGMMSGAMTAHRDRMMRLMDLYENRMQHQTSSR
jgi:hypothetical protein